MVGMGLRLFYGIQLSASIPLSFVFLTCIYYFMESICNSTLF